MIVFIAGSTRPGLQEYLVSCGDQVREGLPELAGPSADPAVAAFAVMVSAAALDQLAERSVANGRAAMFVSEWALAPSGRVPAGVSFLPDSMDDARVREQLLAIAERSRREASLRRKLDDARDELIRFSERVSHDLLAVFQNIEGFARVLSERLSDRLDEKEAHYLERIRSGSSKGTDVVRDAALLVRAAWSPLHRGEVDLAAVAQRCVSKLTAREGTARIRWDIGSLPRVRGDEAALELAVWHLLDNAVKFTRGTPSPFIRVRGVQGAGSVELQVKDSGVGFDPGYAQRLFQPFERLHSGAEFEGNGVGLAYVRTVARRHGGDARAELPGTGGALFAITLPTVGDAPVRAEQPATTPSALSVLLVDDDPLVLLTIKGMLQRDGHSVAAVSGVEMALQELGAHPDGFDLVISDWSMPHLGGEHLVQAVSRDYAATAVFVLTGRRPDDKDAWPANVREVLGKPIRLADLRAAIARLRASSAPKAPGPVPSGS